MLNRSASSRRQQGSSSTLPLQQSRQSRSATCRPRRRSSLTLSYNDDERASFNVISINMDRFEQQKTIALQKPKSLEEFAKKSVVILDDNVIRRSSKNSLIPAEFHLNSSRNSLAHDNYKQVASNSVISDNGRSPRNSLVPDNTPRHSVNYDCIHTTSLTPNYYHSPRSSLVPDTHCSSKNQFLLVDDVIGCSWQNIAESCKSTRGGIGQESVYYKHHSPRESIASKHYESSQRGSIAKAEMNSSRFSKIRNDNDEEGSISRGSNTVLTFQERNVERNHIADSNSGFRRKCEKCKSMSEISTGASNVLSHEPSSKNAITTATTITLAEGESRRPSSNSQVSDEQRRLCSVQKSTDCEHDGLGFRLSLTTYGSVAYQLKDANLEANGMCEFICKGLDIVNKTGDGCAIVVSILMVCLATLPCLMLIMGIQFLRDCPREPYIPIYMIVGGLLGCVEMAWILWNQFYNRRLEISTMDTSSIVYRIAFFTLTLFLIVWFAMGNYWILSIRWPEFNPRLFEPNQWCHRTLYLFSYIHLFIVHSTFGVLLLLVICLGACQIFGCLCLEGSAYK